MKELHHCQEENCSGVIQEVARAKGWTTAPLDKVVQERGMLYLIKDTLLEDTEIEEHDEEYWECIQCGVHYSWGDFNFESDYVASVNATTPEAIWVRMDQGAGHYYYELHPKLRDGSPG